MDEEKLRRLALRLLATPVGLQLEKPDLLVESLPEKLPVDIPLPEQHTLLGTLVRGPKSLEIVLDVPLTAKEVRDFYAQTLLAHGWSTPENEGLQRGGFIHSFHNANNFTSYIQEPDWRLNLQLSATINGITNTRLSLQQEDPRSRRQRTRIGRDIFAIFPPLFPPEGAMQQGRGGSGGGDSAHTSATLDFQEARAIADLYAHYTSQLKEAGWASLKSEHTEHAAWSTWQFQDKDNEEWLGAFYIFTISEERPRYYVSIYANLKDAPQPNWFLHAPLG